MIALSVALCLVLLAAVWAARDVALRILDDRARARRAAAVRDLDTLDRVVALEDRITALEQRGSPVDLEELQQRVETLSTALILNPKPLRKS